MLASCPVAPPSQGRLNLPGGHLVGTQSAGRLRTAQPSGGRNSGGCSPPPASHTKGAGHQAQGTGSALAINEIRSCRNLAKVNGQNSWYFPSLEVLPRTRLRLILTYNPNHESEPCSLLSVTQASTTLPPGPSHRRSYTSNTQTTASSFSPHVTTLKWQFYCQDKQARKENKQTQPLVSTFILSGSTQPTAWFTHSCGQRLYTFLILYLHVSPGSLICYFNPCCFY